MKKLLFVIFFLMIVSIAACQQQAKEPAMEKKADVVEKVPATTATGEAVVDSVGNDLTNVDTVEKDLSADELGDLDSGLTEVQNI